LKIGDTLDSADFLKYCQNSEAELSWWEGKRIKRSDVESPIFEFNFSGTRANNWWQLPASSASHFAFMIYFCVESECRVKVVAIFSSKNFVVTKTEANTAELDVGGARSGTTVKSKHDTTDTSTSAGDSNGPVGGDLVPAFCPPRSVFPVERLPLGWSKHFAPKTGRAFYYHASTGRSTWHLLLEPLGTAESAQAKDAAMGEAELFEFAELKGFLAEGASGGEKKKKKKTRREIDRGVQKVSPHEAPQTAERAVKNRAVKNRAVENRIVETRAAKKRVSWTQDQDKRSMVQPSPSPSPLALPSPTFDIEDTLEEHDLLDLDFSPLIPTLAEDMNSGLEKEECSGNSTDKHNHKRLLPARSRSKSAVAPTPTPLSGRDFHIRRWPRCRRGWPVELVSGGKCTRLDGGLATRKGPLSTSSKGTSEC
jgi:hypothetical protein